VAIRMAGAAHNAVEGEASRRGATNKRKGKGCALGRGNRPMVQRP